MTDPIAEYQNELKKLETKKEAAIQSLKERLKGEKAAVKTTEKQIEDLTGPNAQGGEKKKRKKSTRVLTDAHKAAMAEGRRKKKAANLAAAGGR